MQIPWGEIFTALSGFVVWFVRRDLKRSRDLDIAFTKIRALEIEIAQIKGSKKR